MNPGDIVLVPFPFTDLTGAKNRPAIVLVTTPTDLVVSFLTSQLKRKSQFDVELNPSHENGLKMKSIVRLNKITTIDTDLVIGKLGSVRPDDRRKIKTGLIQLLSDLD